MFFKAQALQAVIENGHGECSSANVAENKRNLMEASRGVPSPCLRLNEKEGTGDGVRGTERADFPPCPTPASPSWSRQVAYYAFLNSWVLTCKMKLIILFLSVILRIMGQCLGEGLVQCLAQNRCSVNGCLQ